MQYCEAHIGFEATACYMYSKALRILNLSFIDKKILSDHFLFTMGVVLDSGFRVNHQLNY